MGFGIVFGFGSKNSLTLTLAQPYVSSVASAKGEPYTSSMRLSSLTLEHFRNYASLALTLADADRHVFLGPNGSGKTNVLEAVSVLSLHASFRGREDQDLVSWGETFYRITGEIEAESGERSRLEVVTVLEPRRRKAALRNDVPLPLSSLVGMLPSVTFLPQDLFLFGGPPTERRRFLDQLLCQVSPEYMATFSAYRKVLQQRNALLRRIVRGEEAVEALDLWDRELAQRGSQITLSRLELIETLNCTFAEELASLGEWWEETELRYERRSTERDQAAMEQELRLLLGRSRERDLLLQSTTVGPHREDWQVMSGGRELPAWASRGQERTAVLALLFLEVSYLELRRGERPIILLDDVFSELDPAHQEALLQSLKGHQVLMTATHLPSTAVEMSVWDVTEGSVCPTSTKPTAPSARGTKTR